MEEKSNVELPGNEILVIPDSTDTIAFASAKTLNLALGAASKGQPAPEGPGWDPAVPSAFGLSVLDILAITVLFQK